MKKNVKKFNEIIPTGEIIFSNDKISMFKMINPNAAAKKYKNEPSVETRKYELRNIKNKEANIILYFPKLYIWRRYLCRLCFSTLFLYYIVVQSLFHQIFRKEYSNLFAKYVCLFCLL